MVLFDQQVRNQKTTYDKENVNPIYSCLKKRIKKFSPRLICPFLKTRNKIMRPEDQKKGYESEAIQPGEVQHGLLNQLRMSPSLPPLL
jgi:hypothetical protein